jgi:hypothetical protein
MIVVLSKVSMKEREENFPLKDA